MKTSLKGDCPLCYTWGTVSERGITKAPAHTAACHSEASKWNWNAFLFCSAWQSFNVAFHSGCILLTKRKKETGGITWRRCTMCGWPWEPSGCTAAPDACKNDELGPGTQGNVWQLRKRGRVEIRMKRISENECSEQRKRRGDGGGVVKWDGGGRKTNTEGEILQSQESRWGRKQEKQKAHGRDRDSRIH